MRQYFDMKNGDATQRLGEFLVIFAAATTEKLTKNCVFFLLERRQVDANY